ncbi:MAG: ATP-binding cassette domain-containing protein [Odoribacter sp.]|nr:ATP-binding cassette domain-containing protein [Odoribacter sp.]
MQNLEYIIDVRNVYKKYGDKVVLDNINLFVKKGEFVTILGPSGCGKTTLLRLIAGFLPATSGTILIDGKDITGIPPYKRPVNTVFQKYALFPHLNVYDNIAFGLKLKKLSKKEIDKKITRVLKIVGMTDYEEREIDSLSGGQQQRVAIARAIVNEPEVLLLDEPLAALDLKMRKDMQMELKDIHHNLNITFLYVTHDQEEALTLSDTVVVMSDGVIQQIGTPTDIYNEPVNSFVANFIEESNILNATMIRDGLVHFAGKDFECVDKGFGENTPVDVVIRPEDIDISFDPTAGMLSGQVQSVVFKGVHYELTVITQGSYELLIQNYCSYEVGQFIGLSLHPQDIHVMKKERVTNTFEGRITGEKEVEFMEQIFEWTDASDIPKDAPVLVEVDFEDVELMDNEGMIDGEIKYILFKGDRYHLTVVTEDGYTIYADTQDVWDVGDRVGICINPEKIRVNPI